MASRTKLPVVYLPHGGGPWPFVESAPQAEGNMRDAHPSLEAYLLGLQPLREQAAAVLVISAHWEAARPTLMGASSPTMLYDYGGFPPET